MRWFADFFNFLRSHRNRRGSQAFDGAGWGGNVPDINSTVEITMWHCRIVNAFFSGVTQELVEYFIESRSMTEIFLVDEVGNFMKCHINKSV